MAKQTNLGDKQVQHFCFRLFRSWTRSLCESRREGKARKSISKMLWKAGSVFVNAVFLRKVVADAVGWRQECSGWLLQLQTYCSPFGSNWAAHYQITVAIFSDTGQERKNLQQTKTSLRPCVFSKAFLNLIRRNCRNFLSVRSEFRKSLQNFLTRKRNASL